MRNQGTGSWIHRRRVKSAGRPALVAGDRTITYDVLADRIDRLTHALAARGVTAGDRVAYLGENHPAFVETLFATGCVGAILVPLNTRLAPPEIAYQLNDSGAALLIHADESGAIAEAAAGRIPRIAVGGSPGGAEEYDDVVGAARAGFADLPVALNDPALIMYTSGTTGHPKGAVLSHGNITWNSLNILVDYDLTSSAVALMISPMFHAAALGMGVLPVLLKGGCVVLEPRFDAGRALRLIARHRVTSLSGVPTTFQLICEHTDWETTDLSSLTMLTCGGAPVPERVRVAYEERGLAFTGGYGMTETSPDATSLPPRYSQARSGSAGLAHFFTDVRVVDGEGQPAVPGAAGEVQIHGPNVVAGYWNRPEARTTTFTDDGWLRSGDIGHLDEDGFLYISDRVKDMIISGGENIYPAEVEQVILEIGAVAAVAVVGVPDETWGEVPRAYVEAREGHSVTGEEIRAHLDGRLARYKIPRQVVMVAELPRTATGKVLKRALRQH